MTLSLARRLLRFICALLMLISYSQSSSFKPNCTVPIDSVNYVAGPNTRSTLSIVWNCFSVIILCTWNVLHLNVPPVRHAQGFWKNTCLAIMASTTKIKWMVVTTLVPEYLLGKALSERLAVKATLPLIEKHIPMAGKEWGEIHCYLANMGYFVLDVQPERRVPIKRATSFEEEQYNKPAPNSRDEAIHEDAALIDVERGEKAAGEKRAKKNITGMFCVPSHTNEIQNDPANMPRSILPADELIDLPREIEEDIPYVGSPSPRPYQALIQELLDEEGLSTPKRINLDRLQYRYWALNAVQWKLAFSMDIATVPNIPAVYLNKLDGGGALVKALAIGQVLYLIIQLISREVQGLPSSQLEIATLAFSVLSLFTYLTYWGHPQNIETIHIIPAKKSRAGGGTEIFKKRIGYLTSLGPSYMWTRPRTKSKFDPKLGPSPIPNDASNLTGNTLPKELLRALKVDEDIVIWALGAVFGGIPFGGLHCLAWNVRFPTTAEADAWKACSVIATLLPLVTLAPILMWANINSRFSRGSAVTCLRLPVVVVVLFCLLLYILARLFLLVEMIRCLFFLPPEAFIDTWSNGFPHWG
ncbi:hypothetical protein F4776DRAFT_89573 [Hypoxylon sp. NC0597]|nr:hypothetical protein F4776DRAFT_89573 [Hypoxylon sp. NC0597]